MRLTRTGLVLTGLSAASCTWLAPGATDSVEALGSPDLPTSLVALGSLLQLALATWILATLALSQVPGAGRLVRLVTPRLLRRAMFAGVAGALVLGPAHAERVAGPEQPVGVPDHSLTGLALPDRPTLTPPDVPPATPEPTTPQPAEPAPAEPAEPAPPADVVTVAAGDTLWSIAARHLPDDATTADVATAVAAWHEVNRAVIGADPDLIVPLQQLTPPGKDRP